MFDYIDFGTSKGSNQIFLGEQIGCKGLGIDHDLQKVQQCRDKGLQAIVADIKKVPFPDKCCRVVGIVHVLEHLSGYEEALLVINEGIRLATTLIYIVVPYFDQDRYLAKRGFYLEWSKYVGHSYHITRADLKRLGAASNKRIVINKKHPILSSNHPVVKAISTKQNVCMLEDVYRELEVLIMLD